MRGLAIDSPFDFSEFIYSAINIQEGYAILSHCCLRHLYWKLNVGIYPV